MSEQAAILLIYTGGTIGMVQDPKTKSLKPFDFTSSMIEEVLPGLKHFDVKLQTLSFDEIIDSSDMNPAYWIKIAEVIESHYHQYDGFVVLHGTDTMSYTASALSFMLEGLQKPVILTGSQLPLGVLRSDGKDNIITSIEIAAKKENGKAVVPEVCICFENTLYRGNRTTKFSAEQFNAFISGNYPPLAEVGIHIKYNHHIIHQPDVNVSFKVHKTFDNRLVIMKLFPGISQAVVESILATPDLQGVIIETYGSGNAPSHPWLYDALRKAHDRGVILWNITQCKTGSVEMGKYEASVALQQAGVISGKDITTESAITKMMWAIGNKELSIKEKENMLQKSVCGEMTE